MLDVRALVVLREGCRSAQYEGSCSARREGCCTIRRYLLPLNLVEVSLAPGHVMSGALICENYDMVQCCFELVVTDELRFQACGHGDAVECFQRREIRFNTSTFTQLRSLASTDHDAAPLEHLLGQYSRRRPSPGSSRFEIRIGSCLLVPFANTRVELRQRPSLRIVASYRSSATYG